MNIDLDTMTSELALPILTDQQLDTLERIHQVRAIRTKSMGKRIGATHWINAIRDERQRRGAR